MLTHRWWEQLVQFLLSIYMCPMLGESENVSICVSLDMSPLFLWKTYKGHARKRKLGYIKRVQQDTYKTHAKNMREAEV